MVDRQEMIQNLKSIPFDPRFIKGPNYHNVHKMLAQIYFEDEKDELLGIYHLTEAHGASFRIRTVIKYNFKNGNRLQVNNPNEMQGLDKEYVRFDSDLAKKEEKGMLERLREMPKEWTLVQVTQENDVIEGFSRNPKQRPCQLHISRLPCGSELDFNVPACVTVEKPRGSDENMPFVYDVINDAVNVKLHTKNCPASKIRKLRDEASKQIKTIVPEISDGWLREWRCMFLGELCNKTYKDEVRKCIEPFTKGLSPEKRHKLYAIANACAHLSEDEIYSAVSQIVADSEVCQRAVQEIVKFRTERQLIVAKRHPVLLIIEEKLDLLPWEMMGILKRHPVTRVSSIHFAHALFKEHQQHIVDGNRIIRQSDLGFYIINPDKDLVSTETKLVKFLEKRVPEWKGVSGIPPSPEQFASVLMENNLILYCGHGSGTNLLQGKKQIEDLQVVAMPLLFGCSSVQLQHPGGRAQYWGTADNYLMAGSACVLGMLWIVTSDDTDSMTAMLLNCWLPGDPVDLSDFRTSEDMDTMKHEPELLRVMKLSRNVANSYANSAALICRGIPVKMSQEKQILKH